MLVAEFLRTADPIEVRADRAALADFLVAEGALQQLPSNKYICDPPLIRFFLSMHVNEQRKQITSPVPMIGQVLDVEGLVIGSLLHFNRKVFLGATELAFKGARGPGLPRGTAVPSEATYHFEQFAIITNWLPTYYLVFPETRLVAITPSDDVAEASEMRLGVEAPSDLSIDNAGPSAVIKPGKIRSSNTEKVAKRARANKLRSLAAKACDITIVSARQNYVIEYLASDTEIEVEKHYAKALAYAKAQRAKVALVVHFSACPPPHPTELTYPVDVVDGIKCIGLHIYHDLQCEKVLVFRKGQKPWVGQFGV